MSVCLALAVIYSFGYPGSTPLTSGAGASGTVLAQGAGSFSDVTVPATGYVGEEQLVAPETTSPFGTTDSLVPGRAVPGAEESPRATATADKTPSVEPLSSMPRPGKGMLISPLQFLNPSSPFGLRTSPITGEHNELHTGQDFAAPCGTRVFSADSGVVRAAGWHPWGGGNRVELDHGNGLVTTYNHLEGIGVKAGDRVGAGQVIATVGTTGWSTGCHLHFETILDGGHTDPGAWKLIPLDGSGPVEMPSLVNFTPGTGSGNDDDTAWVAYLATATAFEPVAVKSPSRVDAEVAAQGQRASGKAASGTKSSSSASLSTSSGSKKATQPLDTPSTSVPGTTTPSKPGTPPPSSSTPSKPGTPPPPSTTTPPPAEPGTPPLTDPGTPTPPPTIPVAPDPTPPVDPGTPTPSPLDPTPPVDPGTPTPSPLDPTPFIPDPTPPIVADPTPADPPPPAADPGTPAPATPPTVSVTDPLAACDPAIDPKAIIVDAETKLPVLDPITNQPVTAAELCASVSVTPTPGITGTEPAREADPGLTTAP